MCETSWKIAMLKVGDRVRLKRDLELFPIIIVPAGDVGTVTEVQDYIVWIKLDTHYDELEEWDNNISYLIDMFEEAKIIE